MKIEEIREILGDKVHLEAVCYMSEDENKEFEDHLKTILDNEEDVEFLTSDQIMDELIQYWSTDTLTDFEEHCTRMYDLDNI